MTSTQGGRRVIKTTPRLALFSPSTLSSFFPVARSSARRVERGKLAKNFSGRDISISIQGLFERQWKQLLSGRDARVTVAVRRSDDGVKQELKGEKESWKGWLHLPDRSYLQFAFTSRTEERRAPFS